MESLNDPTDDRVIKEVPAPPHRPISDDLLYPNKCKLTQPMFLINIVVVLILHIRRLFGCIE